MSRYLLHRDVYLCLVDGGAVLLDVRKTEYLAIDAAHFSGIAAFLVGWSIEPQTTEKACNTTAISSVIADLVRRDILTTSPREGKVVQVAAITTRHSRRSVPHRTDAGQMGWRDLRSFILSVLTVASRLRRRDLLRLVRKIEAAKARLGGPPGVAVALDAGTLMNKFDRLRVWCYSADRACLKDSLVLSCYLLNRGVSPTFVIGIRTKPFTAHAWVQSGDVVLNDSLENVQRYTPILAI